LARWIKGETVFFVLEMAICDKPSHYESTSNPFSGQFVIEHRLENS